MASHPDPDPDSPPAGSPDAVEQVSPGLQPGRQSVEDVPVTREDEADAGDETDDPNETMER
jgi:hypothetical protein